MKVLHLSEQLGPGGGPGGYLWNLKGFLEQDGFEGVVIACLPKSKTARKFLTKRLDSVRKRISFLKKRCFIELLSPTNAEFDWRRLDHDFADFDLIVAHSSSLAWACLEKRKKGQKIYLFQHSPTDATTERLEMLSPKYGVSDRDLIYRSVAPLELSIFNAVDGIMAPCVNSLDGYFSSSDTFRCDFKKILKNKKFVQIITGVPSPMIKANKPDFLSVVRSAREEGKKVVGYFGRYHLHKGYDYFYELVCRFEGDSGYLFISAGSGCGITVPSSNNYVDLGLLEKSSELPHAIALCSWVCIPNRFTYFDLIALEVMALGRPIITTDTGGNKFLKTCSDGVLAVAADKVVDEMQYLLKEFSEDELENLGKANAAAYLKHFSMECFVKQHLMLCEDH